MPSLGRFSQPFLPWLEEAMDRETTPYCGLAGESNGNGDAGQLWVKPKSN